MAKHRYLVLLRSQPTTGGQSPSPEQIQQMLAAYRAWMERFKSEIADIGDQLKPGGRVLTASGSMSRSRTWCRSAANRSAPM